MRFLFVLMVCFPSVLLADILVFKNCTSKDYDFEKNDYKLDLKNRTDFYKHLSIHVQRILY